MHKKIIDIGNIRSNLLYITNKHTNVMAMVKANAYGHGMKQVASAIKDKVKFWGVANVKEALSLRKMLSNEHTILVVGKTNNYKTLIKNNIHITIDELTELNKIIKICKNNNLTCNIHIAINTGMNRIGVKTLCSFKKFLKKINQNNFIKLSGIFTHLFDADYTKSNFYAQMCRFEKFVNLVKNKNILIHIGGSYCLNKKLPSFINMVRVGLFLYGYGNDKLKKTLKINSQVIKITSCKKGE